MRVENISFRYRKGSEVFRDLSLEIQPGRIYGLLGLNGSGKTTLLKLMSGLRFPQQGRCSLDGMSGVERHPDYLAQVFLVPEEFRLPSVRIDTFKSLYAPFYKGFSDALFQRVLTDFGLGERDQIGDLSFGFRKKVFIAFALATQCRVLLMDEPTNGLDIPSKKQFRRILAEQAMDSRCFVISTHQVRDLGSMLDYLLILHHQSLLLSASVEELATRVAYEETQEKPEGEDVLFVEKNFSGYRSLKINHSGEESPFDTELLFHAAMAQPERWRQLFADDKK